MDLKNLVQSIFGTRHDREVKRLTPIVERQIGAEVERLSTLSDDDIAAQTLKFRTIIRERTEPVEAELEELRQARRESESASEREDYSLHIGDLERRLTSEIQKALDDSLPEAFATVKEAARRLVGTEVQVTGQTLSWDMVPYDVQLIGGISLHQGKVAEMATGEGKTLVATLPLYLNALAGRGAHLVTVNTYLAQRDSEWMGHLFHFLGRTVGAAGAAGTLLRHPR